MSSSTPAPIPGVYHVLLPTVMLSTAVVAYDLLRQWMTLLPLIAGPVTYFIDAPFGRFTPKSASMWTVDGITAWILMELPSPLTFAATFYCAPLTAALIPNFTPHLASPFPFSPFAGSSGSADGAAPASLLALLFLAHYLNRALVSPLRTPSRSRSHVIVPLAATCFNLANGFLMGAYLSSPAARAHLAGAYAAPRFWAGVALAVAGLAGNILHDEILFDIRRDANKAKAKAAASPVANEDQKAAKTNAEAEAPKKGGEKEHYAIPHGCLYALVSYPNYLCEWAEWAGFALAAAPLPAAVALAARSWTGLGGMSPPWIFLLAEVVLMAPRALKGHAWYRRRFADYPRERRAVVPWVL
ncbi:hypothetical protein FIBSPDRAFT_964371 [Athelia psychrophila]|uniref:3-oxo-5-alpha-steroid 4-dehydrogenase C-terminal domain-containing protein n=1 Tax=Athelia psychrophila TaxID=1759441 RepID=A0A165XV72_9AGAM|nr:hypothetical protein FIBSPDRAFT_964371 [Fibularhizoctonia sp. CBS 109695]